MSDPWAPQFVFCTCQHGAEAALKREPALQLSGAVPAFSRPGFVTFKLAKPCDNPEGFNLSLTFARLVAFSIGQVRGDRLNEMARQLWELDGVQAFLAAAIPRDVHVWQRDLALPGENGFEPSPSPLALEAEAAIRQAASVEGLRRVRTVSSPSPRGWVLDVVLVEPNQWWVGCHRAASRLSHWPGGILPLALPDYAVSRAYLKMEEALRWSALQIGRGELCVELGCAPGGAAQALLDCGLHVIGVDPAEVDESVLAHPHFRHVRKRSKEVPRRMFRGVRWLAADMNVAPRYTLDAVEAIVAQPNSSVRGLLLTLKLSDWQVADELPQIIKRVRSWGFADVRTRQLAYQRRELCLVALRSRGQRRVVRGAKRRRRVDPAHAGIPGVPHLPTDI